MSMGPLLEACKPTRSWGRKLFQIEFLTTLSGEAWFQLVLTTGDR